MTRHVLPRALVLCVLFAYGVYECVSEFMVCVSRVCDCLVVSA